MNKKQESDKKDDRNPEHQSGGYNSDEYYRRNRELGNEASTGYNRPSAQSKSFENDLPAEDYDQINTGKYENYGGGGYYGSTYGGINSRNIGRDYEQNSGYRNHYNRLTNDRNNANDIGAGHRGKGPRAYRRSDFRIQEDINDLLLEDHYVDATEIEVKVENAEVILSGMVADRNMKRRVDELLESVHGVQHFENRLRVRTNSQMVNITNSAQK
jgi:osmotically-inducible protein OsmY